MSKKFKGKICVYCQHPNSDDGDHVICRQFFLPQHRENLPKVPSCRRCNKEKSELEHYLTSVLPFGGRHADAGALIRMVPPRLENNAKLHSLLSIGRKTTFFSNNGGPWSPQMSIPFDSDRLLALYEYIAKGLAWHHWKIYLGKNHIVKAGFFTRAGQGFLGKLLSLNGNRIQVNLGHDSFIYEGLQSEECPELTVWRMSLYGAELGGDRKACFERCSNAYVITAPKKMPAASKFVQLLWGNVS